MSYLSQFVLYARTAIEDPIRSRLQVVLTKSGLSGYQGSLCELVTVTVVKKLGMSGNQDSTCELVPATMMKKSGLSGNQGSSCELVPVTMLSL